MSVEENMAESNKSIGMVISVALTDLPKDGVARTAAVSPACVV